MVYPGNYSEQCYDGQQSFKLRSTYQISDQLEHKLRSCCKIRVKSFKNATSAAFEGAMGFGGRVQSGYHSKQDIDPTLTQPLYVLYILR